MMTLTEFQQTASSMNRKIDNAALLRHYHAWLKAAKKQDCSACSYIQGHLPKQDQQEITEVLAPYGTVTLSEIVSAQRWFQSRKLPVYDTISGLYVDTASAGQLTAFLDHFVAVFPVFEDFCQERAYSPSRDKYEMFLREIHGQYIKVKCCPFRLNKEFWGHGADTLRPYLERWYAISAAYLPGKSGDNLSLGEAAEMMQVTVSVMYDWLQDHSEYIMRKDGRIYLKLEQMCALNEAWAKVLPVESVLVRATIKVPAAHIRRVRERIRSFITEHSPSWILPAKSFPQQKDKLYVNSAKQQEAQLWITDLLNQIPIWSYKNLRECTKLSLRELREKIDEGVIQAEPYGNGDWLLCTNERNRIFALSEILISVDDALESIFTENICEFQMGYACNRENLFHYAENHNWWDAEVYPSKLYPLHGGKLGMLISIEDADQLREELRIWLLLYGKSCKEQWETLCNVYATFPKTVKILRRRYLWLSSIEKPFIDMVCLIMKNLTKELVDLSESEKLALFEAISSEATEATKKEFIAFAKFEKIIPGHIELRPSGRKIDNSAYPIESFRLMYNAMLTESEIERRDLIKKAVDNKKYADLWLYTAIHVFLPWRNTDYDWVRPPELPYDPDETLNRIKNGTFSKEDAKLVALRFIVLLELDIRNPNKTDGAHNTQNLFYNFPESEHYVLGLILSIVAAHYYKDPKDPSFIKCRQIADRVSIANFYGPDYLQACQNRNYSGHRANKALMQAMEFQGREGKHYHAEYAYVISSMVRSHSFGYGQASGTTDVYLRDAAFSGMTPEFIAFQMFQRGICSFIVDIMMNDCYGEQYKFLPVSIKTDFLKEVGLPLVHLDNTSLTIERAMNEAVAVVEEVASGKAEMEDVLHAIALGHGHGKDCTSICLCKAADLQCKCLARMNCLGCRYEIKSKAVLVQYIMHAVQLKNKTCTSLVEQQKRDWLLENTINPAIQEISYHIRQSADEDERSLYRQIIREVENNGITGKDQARGLLLLPRYIQS